MERSIKIRPFLSGDMLKAVAALSMLTDHVAASVLLALLHGGAFGAAAESWQQVYHVMRSVGRAAFPIYAFLLTEGFFHTGNRINYICRMAVFAALSEAPFDLAIYGELTWRAQNTFLTLLLGLLVLTLSEKIGARGKGQNGKWELLSVVLLSVAGGCLAELLHSDYGIHGILLIALFYESGRLERQIRQRQDKAGQRERQAGTQAAFLSPVRAAACTMGYFLFLWEPWSVFGFLPILFYNGTRKHRGRGFRYFFYCFYPLHLLILAGIRVALCSGL